MVCVHIQCLYECLYVCTICVLRYMYNKYVYQIKYFVCVYSLHINTPNTIYIHFHIYIPVVLCILYTNIPCILST